MPNQIRVAQEFYTKTPTGKVIRAIPRLKFDPGNDLWDITVYNENYEPVAEYAGWPEDRTLAFMEFFECGDEL